MVFENTTLIALIIHCEHILNPRDLGWRSSHQEEEAFAKKEASSNKNKGRTHQNRASKTLHKSYNYPTRNHDSWSQKDVEDQLNV